MWVPQIHEVSRWLGFEVARSPLNLSALLALLALLLAWLYLWHTRWGYELRALGHSEPAALATAASPRPGPWWRP